MSVPERSVSRGREAFSTGRGGLGNIRQSSLSRDTRSESGPDDFSVARGREPISSPKQIFSTGRGGAGNIRSPSRDPQKTPVIEGVEQDVINAYKKSQEGAPVSSGRGGLGNINRSRSRDPAAVSNPTAARGGVGNIVQGDGSVAESIDEYDVKKLHVMPEECLSTNAKITSTHEPVTENHPRIGDGYQSAGREGAGNTVKETT